MNLLTLPLRFLVLAALIERVCFGFENRIYRTGVTGLGWVFKPKLFLVAQKHPGYDLRRWKHATWGTSTPGPSGQKIIKGTFLGSPPGMSYGSGRIAKLLGFDTLASKTSFNWNAYTVYPKDERTGEYKGTLKTPLYKIRKRWSPFRPLDFVSEVLKCGENECDALPERIISRARLRKTWYLATFGWTLKWEIWWIDKNGFKEYAIMHSPRIKRKLTTMYRIKALGVNKTGYVDEWRTARDPITVKESSKEMFVRRAFSFISLGIAQVQ